MADPDSFFANDSSRGSLHIICRKLNTLTTLKNAQFAVSAKKPIDEPFARLGEKALDRETRRMQWQRRMRTIGMWTTLTGTGCCKLGIDSMYQYGEAAYSDKIPRKSDYYDEYKDQPYGPLTEYTDPSIRVGEVNMIHIPTTNVFANPEATTRDTVTRWYIRYQRPLIDALRDYRYDPQARGALRGMTTNDARYSVWLDERDDEERLWARYCEVVECFDLSSRQVCVFTEYGNKPLIDWHNFRLDVFCPLHLFTPIDHPTNWRGMPYAMLIYNQHKSINQLRALLKAKIGSDGKTVYAYDPDRITEEQLTPLRKARDGEWVPIEGLLSMMQNGEEFFKVIEFGKPNPDILRMMQMFENDLQFMSGMDEPTRGIETGGEKTATEVSVRQQQQSLTISDYVARNEEFQEEVAGDVLRLVVQNWDQQKLVKVCGSDDDSYFWVNIERERMRTEFDLEVVAGSTEKMDSTTYRRQYNEMTDRLVQVAGVAMQENQLVAQGIQPTGIVWSEVIRRLVNNYEPCLGNQILNKRDPFALMMDLIQQHNIWPVKMSADLEQRLVAAFASPPPMQGQQPGMQPGQQPGGMPPNVVPMPGQQGTPTAVQQPQVNSMNAPQDMAGFTSGRQMSEAHGGS
ncbi:MAG TPA: hypothetical protein P5179_13025 [Candidatus Latescibacteria bacterium]|nr:hypothetical protein [Candidatus Latescibacterota bacterium]